MISRQIVMSPNLLFIKILSPKLDGMCRRSGCRSGADSGAARYATAVRCAVKMMVHEIRVIDFDSDFLVRRP